MFGAEFHDAIAEAFESDDDSEGAAEQPDGDSGDKESGAAEKTESPDPKPEPRSEPEVPSPGAKVHAGPAVRKLAREFGGEKSPGFVNAVLDELAKLDGEDTAIPSESDS